ncbi:hypothetical protein XaC1_511 [Xanthomonas phage XaC1]|nr:hypothetical protein XaC1_511 [Xanthomonas phage XaC1]
MHPNARRYRTQSRPLKLSDLVPQYRKKEIPDNVIRVDFQAKKKI